MAKETNEILGHGDEADGIEEYDNPLPDWWIGLFILTVIYGVGYGINYHFIAETSQEKQYMAEMAIAEVKWPAAENAGPFEMDDALVASGQEVYDQTCASCHKADLTGGIGPSLVDDEWIHGGAPEEIVQTVTNGVADKGMPAWGKILGPNKVNAAVAYVVSKNGGIDAMPEPGQGTGAKAPTEEPAVADVTPEPAEPTVAADATPEKDGKQIYDVNCAACHGPNMEGLVGPNLLDDEWIHGSELEQIKLTIINGVPEKGMTSWGPILGEEKVDLVARYVHMKATGTL